MFKLEELEILTYEIPFGKYAGFKDGFFIFNDEGKEIIHDKSELIYLYSDTNKLCHHFICELLGLYSGLSEFNSYANTCKFENELPRIWDNSPESVMVWFNKNSHELWYKLAEKLFDNIMENIQANAKELKER